ncbi:MAG TPA: hypothetical protein VFD98_08650 [Terracidiphilus sp.]|nr:hypothetical protein [Terracidiphilus sp.]
MGLPIKTLREYQYRLRQIDGDHRPRGWHGHTRQMKGEATIAYEEIQPADAAIEVKGGQMVEERSRVPQERSAAVERSEMSELLETRRSEIDSEWREVVAFSTVEGAAAVNYWRGRAEEYNAFRDALVRQHPEREKDLPPALQVDEIQVRQVVLEQERSEDKSLQVAPRKSIPGEIGECGSLTLWNQSHPKHAKSNPC